MSAKGKKPDGIRHIPISDGNARPPAAEPDESDDAPLRSATELADERAAEILKDAEARGAVQEAAEPEDLPPATELLDKLKRVKADFANYQRRTEAERESWAASGKRAVLSALLPALDQLEITVGSAEEHQDYDGLKEAVNLVSSEIQKFLGGAGVERIKALGETFDPEIHEALFTRPADDVEPGVIVDVLRPGYAVGDHVLRPAQVVVSAAPPAEPAAAAEDELDREAPPGEDVPPEE